MSKTFAQDDFRSVELIWYDFLSHGTVFGPWYEFGTVLVQLGTILLPMVRPHTPHSIHAERSLE